VGECWGYDDTIVQDMYFVSFWTQQWELDVEVLLGLLFMSSGMEDGGLDGMCIFIGGEWMCLYF
jgi:hypothetical protein